jgi:hypothetical protein
MLVGDVDRTRKGSCYAVSYRYRAGKASARPALIWEGGMALEFSGEPFIEWHKERNSKGEYENQLCLCIWIKNTGARDVTARCDFYAYRPMVAGEKDEICKDSQVTIKAGTSQKACCCNHEAEIKNAVLHGHLAINSSDVDGGGKDIDGTKIAVYNLKGEKISISDKPE